MEPTEPQITLFSSDLLSKWGFNDGDEPHEWYDYCEAHGIDYREVGYPLVELVRRFLLPKIEQNVTVVEIETLHNPIRVDTVDGVDITEAWFGRSPEPALTPECVEILMPEVARVAQELHERAEATR